MKRLLTIVLMLVLTACAPQSRASIQSMIDAASAGDTVTIRAGTYDENLSITKALILEADGDVTLRGMITIRANGVTVRGMTIIYLYGSGIYINSGSTGVIENNKFLYNGAPGVQLSNNTSGWTIRNNYFHRNNTSAAYINGTNHLVENNEVTHIIQHHPCVQATSGADADGFVYFGSGHVFKNNYIHDMPDGGIGYDVTACNVEELADLSNDYDNDSHTDCFQTYGAGSSYPVGHDILFEGNVCELSFSSDWTGGFGQKAWQGSNAYNITIRNNLVIADFISLFSPDCKNIVFDHNTFIGSGSNNYGVKYIDCGSNAGSVKNNIFYGILGDSNGHLEIVNSSVDAGYNCVYPARRPPDPGDVWGVDPRLDSNYHLLPGSPCIGAAEDGSDIGAFQYGGQTPPTITPIPPTRTPTKTPTKTSTPVPPTITPTLTPTITLVPTYTPTSTPIPPPACVRVVWDKGLNLRPGATMYNAASGYLSYGMEFVPLQIFTNNEGVFAQFGRDWWVAMSLNSNPNNVYAVPCP